MRRSSICSLALVALLTTSAGAAASSRHDTRVKMTAEGQRDAKAALLTIGDFAPGHGFKAKAVTSGSSSKASCAGYHPKTSDLVENGNAQASFTNKVLTFSSASTVFQTAAMVHADWQRSVRPSLTTCLRTTVTHSLEANERFVSVADLPFPQVSTYTHAYRAVISLTKSGKTISFAEDIVLIGWGRTEIMFTSLGPTSPAQLTDDVAFAKLLASRIYA
jgi:hypothetical protein